MRVVIQRVLEANVKIENSSVGVIKQGLLVFAGFEENDAYQDVEWIAGKICKLRVFSDSNNKMNLNLKDINGELLLVSQFTLHASYKKGNRPSFITAAKPEVAKHLYEYFIQTCSQLIEKPCATGIFGADMKINLINDGPVTIYMDSKNAE